MLRSHIDQVRTRRGVPPQRVVLLEAALDLASTETRRLEAQLRRVRAENVRLRRENTQLRAERDRHTYAGLIQHPHVVREMTAGTSEGPRRPRPGREAGKK
jgi:regulator of replication initiation timing